MTASVASSFDTRLKGWPGWLTLVAVAVGLVVFGATRDTGPRTPDERIAAIEKRLACPVCDGESVYESRNSASIQIRDRIRQDVADGQLSDQQIIDRIAVVYEGEELLVPTADGVEALAWALPSAAFVAAVGGLAIAFRRWRRDARGLAPATDDDRQLVERALAAVDPSDDREP